MSKGEDTLGHFTFKDSNDNNIKALDNIINNHYHELRPVKCQLP